MTTRFQTKSNPNNPSHYDLFINGLHYKTFINFELATSHMVTAIHALHLVGQDAERVLYTGDVQRLPA
jgi:hypothetical protein